MCIFDIILYFVSPNNIQHKDQLNFIAKVDVLLNDTHIITPSYLKGIVYTFTVQQQPLIRRIITPNG